MLNVLAFGQNWRLVNVLGVRALMSIHDPVLALQPNADPLDFAGIGVVSATRESDCDVRIVAGMEPLRVAFQISELEKLGSREVSHNRKFAHFDVKVSARYDEDTGVAKLKMVHYMPGTKKKIGRPIWYVSTI
jgi:hypothetical protein